MFNLPTYPTLSYLIPLAVVCFVGLFLVFLLLSILFVRMLTEASLIKQGSTKVYEEANDSLNQAREQAFSLINNANKDAEEILKGAHSLSKEVSEQLDTRMENVAREGTEFIGEATDNILKVHRRALLEASKGNINSMKEVSDEFRRELSGEITEFRKGLSSISLEAQRKLDEELSHYKEARMRSIDSAVYKLVEEASLQIIERSLNLQDHEAYILKVLEDARARGDFSDL